MNTTAVVTDNGKIKNPQDGVADNVAHHVDLVPNMEANTKVDSDKAAKVSDKVNPIVDSARANPITGALVRDNLVNMARVLVKANLAKAKKAGEAVNKDGSAKNLELERSDAFQEKVRVATAVPMNGSKKISTKD